MQVKRWENGINRRKNKVSFGLFQKMNMKFDKMGKKINLHLEYMRYLCNDMNIMLALVNYRFIYNLYYVVINHVTSTMDIIVHFWGRLKITSILFFFTIQTYQNMPFCPQTRLRIIIRHDWLCHMDYIPFIPDLCGTGIITPSGD